jgi:hypothetical protein
MPINKMPINEMLDVFALLNSHAMSQVVVIIML